MIPWPTLFHYAPAYRINKMAKLWPIQYAVKNHHSHSYRLYVEYGIISSAVKIKV